MKAVGPKGQWKRTSSRPGKSTGSKERKHQPTDQPSNADPDVADGDQPAWPAADFLRDEDADGIFVPEPSEVPAAAAEQAAADPGPTPEKRGTDPALPQRQGMGRWFSGVTLCLLGTGYIAHLIVNGAAPVGGAPTPGKAPKTVIEGETIHKLSQPPQAATPPSPPDLRRPSAAPKRPAKLVDAALPEPSAAPVAASPPKAEEAGQSDIALAASEAPVSAIVVAPATGLKVIRDCQQCPELIVVPAGKYLMGSPATEPGHQQHEGPQHEVAIAAPFAIGRYEVTFTEWDQCVKEGGCRHRAHDEGWGRRRMPAINVSWRDVVDDFLPWLARKSGKPYRLPSEAEWEYAVRAAPGPASKRASGAAGDASLLCGFANAADDSGGGSGTKRKAIECGDGFARTAPVGSFKPNPWGLHDLKGNVWEWVGDCWNDGYGAAPSDGSAWTSGDCGLRVVRGGSWSSDADKLRAADRGWNRPDGRSPSIGFRVARRL